MSLTKADEDVKTLMASVKEYKNARKRSRVKPKPKPVKKAVRRKKK